MKKKHAIWLGASPFLVLLLYVLSVGPVMVLLNPNYDRLFRPDEEALEPPAIVQMYYPLVRFCLKTKTYPALSAYVDAWDWIIGMLTIWHGGVEPYQIPNESMDGTNVEQPHPEATSKTAPSAAPAASDA